MDGHDGRRQFDDLDGVDGLAPGSLKYGRQRRELLPRVVRQVVDFSVAGNPARS
jgi:hypothetical protein